MDWKLLLGILIGVVSSVIGNAVTQFIPRLWQSFREWQDAGYQSHMRRQIKAAQDRLDQHVQLMVGTQKDLFLFLFQALLIIFAIFILAATCAFLSITLSGLDEPTRGNLHMMTLLFFIMDAIVCAAFAAQCRHLMDKGMEKHKKSLEGEVAKLTAKLPPGGGA